MYQLIHRSLNDHIPFWSLVFISKRVIERYNQWKDRTSFFVIIKSNETINEHNILSQYYFDIIKHLAIILTYRAYRPSPWSSTSYRPARPPLVDTLGTRSQSTPGPLSASTGRCPYPGRSSPRERWPATRREVVPKGILWAAWRLMSTSGTSHHHLLRSFRHILQRNSLQSSDHCVKC